MHLKMQSKQQIIMLRWMLCSLLLTQCAAFTFIYPSVTPELLTINTLTTYTFLGLRNFDITGNFTPYSTQLVPAGSSIVLNFPTQYTLTTPTVSTLLIDDAPVTGFSFTVTTNAITITNAILTNSAIANVTITVDEVLNPYPAITTNPFIINIGADISASSDSSAVTLTPGTFTACSVTFSPTTVNTTGAMVVSITPANKILANDYIVITFPSILQWSQDVSTSHALPIGSALTCTKISGSVSSASCSGSVATAQVTYLISSINGSSLSSSFSFSVSSLFSPPTTSPTDTLKIQSIASSGDNIDSCTSTISGLTAQSLISLTLTSSSSPLNVNNLTSLIFSFSLSDTLAKTDYFQIVFPAGTVFTFSIIISSNLSLFNSNVTYTSANLTLTMRQANASSNKFAATPCSITIGQYKAPPSSKTTDSFTLLVYNAAGGLKMQGTATLTANPNTYITSVSADTHVINKATNYSFTVSTLDVMLSSGSIFVRFPSELSLSVSVSCVVSTNFTAPTTPTCTSNGTNAVIISNLSSANISAGTYTFVIQTVSNAPKALTTSNFTLVYYYNNDTTARVGTSSTSGITLLPNSLNSSTISLTLSNNSVTASSVTLNLTFTAQDAVSSNGYITITIPPQITIISSYTPQCMLYIGIQSAIPSCSLSGSTFKVPINTLAIGSGQKVTVTMIAFAVLPKSTRPTDLFSIYTYSSDNYMVDYSNNSFRLTGLLPVSYFLLSLTPANATNSLSTVYNLKMQQNSPWDANSYLLIQLPTTLTSSNSISCTDSTTNSSSSCSYISNSTANYIKIILATSGSSINMMLSSLVNPQSYKSTDPVVFTTYTSDDYMYALDNSSIVVSNNAPSAFTAVSYSFSSTTYNTTSSLTLDITNLITTTTSYSLTSFAQFVNTSISNITCNSSIDLTCALNGSTLEIKPTVASTLFPISTSIQINGLFIPLANVTSMNLLSYSQNYQVSQYSNVNWQPSCSLPCYTCDSSTFCLSCFPTKIFTSLVYYYNYSCLNSCPAATISLTGSFICSNCDSNCAECSISLTNCTECIQNSTNSKLVIDTRTCISSCGSGYYGNNATNTTKYTSVCQKCIAPCATCTSATNCLTCSNPALFFYNLKCIVSCPINSTVANLTSMQCDLCTPVCATCINTTTTCLTCNISLAPLFIPADSSCASVCPSPLVPENNTICVTCQSPCSTCDLNKNNCTGCLSATNTYLSGLTVGSCVSSCEQFYFANDTSRKCQSCSSVPDLNCKNCYNSTYCLSCDPGYVLFTQNRSCLSFVPSGYVNISGIATACTSNCSQCSVLVDNCTICNGIYSLYTWLGKGSCLITCPNTTVSLINVCVNCTSPCLTCSQTLNNCTSCLTGYLYTSSAGNQCLSVCPNGTYSSLSSTACLNCSSPCLTCLQTSTTCTSCATGYLFNQNCLSSCPSNTMTNSLSMSCDLCASPCLSCQNQTQNCTSCIPSYYYYSVTNRCYSSCPANVSIAGTGNLSFICVGCTSPCATCSLTLTNCTSCLLNLVYFNFTCLSNCLSGYYANAGVCQLCSNNCATCVNQSSLCLSCSGLYKFYINTCIKNCPVAYSIVINNSCTSCSNYCLNCSSSDYCYECQLSSVLIDGKCSTSCPSPLVMYYNETNNKFVCTDLLNSTQAQILKSSLKFSIVLPLPFTIIATFLFVCCLMSKLQNMQTYTTGIGYSLYGCAQTGAIAYLLYIYVKSYSADSEYNSIRLLLIVCLGIIVGLNFVSLLLITPCLCTDVQFNNWLESRKRGTPPKEEDGAQQLSQDMQTLGSEHYQNDSVECFSHKFTFAIFTLLSFVISFKLRLFIFTKLFRFRCLTAHLEDIHGFRVFNLMSVFGIAYEGLCCYICYKMFNLYSFAKDYELMMAVIDSLAMVIVSFILALLTTQKQQDFFKIKQQNKTGVDLGRRKKEKDPKNYKIDTKRLAGMNSRDKLVDINESLSNLGEEGEEIIVNHNIDSRSFPKRVSSSWVQRTTPRKRSKSPLGRTGKNIFQVEEQDESYNPIEPKNTMSARDRIDLFHTSVHPKKTNNVANSFWVEKKQGQPESKFQKSTVNLRERVQSPVRKNLTFDEQKSKKMEAFNNQTQLLQQRQSRIRQKQGQKSVKFSATRPINLADLQYFGQKQDTAIKKQLLPDFRDENEVIKQVDSESLMSRKQKQQKAALQKQTNNNDKKMTDFGNMQEMNKSIEQGRIIESKEKSFQSVLPFVHQDGVLKEKTSPLKKQEKIPEKQLKIAPTKNKVDVAIDAKPPVANQKQQMLDNRQKKELEQLLDLSEVQEKVIKTPGKQKDFNKKNTEQKMRLVTNQIYQTFKPEHKEQPKKTNISNLPQKKNNPISLASKQYNSKVQPIKANQIAIQELQASQKSRKNLQVKPIKEINQKVEPQKHSKQISTVTHAPKVYSRNKLRGPQQLEQIEQIQQFDLKLNKKELQLQRIKEQLLKNNYLVSQKQQNAQSLRRKKTQKNDIESIISQARKTKQNLSSKYLKVQDNVLNSRLDQNELDQEDQIQNIDLNQQSQGVDDTISYRQSERDKIQLRIGCVQDKSNLENRNIFDKQLYTESQALQLQDNDTKTFKKRSENNVQISEADEQIRNNQAAQKNKYQGSQLEQPGQRSSFKNQSRNSVQEKKSQNLQELQKQEAQDESKQPSEDQHNDQRSSQDQQKVQSSPRSNPSQQNGQGSQNIKQNLSKSRHQINHQRSNVQEGGDVDSQNKSEEQQVNDKRIQRVPKQQLKDQSKSSQSQHSQDIKAQNVKSNQQKQNQFQAIKLNNSYHQNQQQPSNKDQDRRSQIKSLHSKAPFIAENVQANISETEVEGHNYTVQKIDQNYEDSNYQSGEQEDKTQIQMRKTNKKEKMKARRYEGQEQYKSPFVFDQNLQSKPRQLAVDYDHGIFQKGRNKKKSQSKVRQQSKEDKDKDKAKNDQEVIKLLNNVAKGGRSRKMLPKEERDERILIKMSREQITSSRNVQNTNLARKSTEKKNPLSTFKYEKKNQVYSQEQDLSQFKRDFNLAKVNTAQNLPTKKIEQPSLMVQQKSPPSYDLYQKQPAFASNPAIKARKPQNQVREFNFGDQISSQVSNTNYNSQAELVKWKQNFVRDKSSSNIVPNYDVNNIPDRPLINKLSQYDEQGDQLQEVIERPRKNRNNRGKKRSKDKGRKSTSRNKNSQLQRIYGN